MSVRFIHTADWQVGLRAAFVPGDAGALVRDARLRAVRRLAGLVETTGAELVVVAGDVFEHHGLRPETIRKAMDALATIRAPVILLPGNHDPWTPESIWRSELWRREAPSNVRVASTTEPLIVREGLVVLPCPLLARHTLDDPTAHLSPSLGPPDAIRIGLAHGGILEILRGMVGEDSEPHNAIGRDVAERGRLDYVALGDWHGLFRVDARTWYSGAIEATRFDERDPGHVLLVEIEGPGRAPVVTPHRVAGLRWVQHELSVDGPEDVERLRVLVDGLPDRSDTLLELAVVGTVDADLRARLDAEVERAGHLLQWVRLRDERLHTILRDEDLDSVATDGWVRPVIDRLRAAPDDDAARALRLLYRLHREVAS